MTIAEERTGYKIHVLPTVDGARLAYGLTAEGCDVTLADLAALTDVFSIGGTKCGALFGEAVVIRHPALRDHFRTYLKQVGGSGGEICV